MKTEKLGSVIIVSIILASLLFVAYINVTTEKKQPIFPEDTVYQFAQQMSLSGYTTPENVSYNFEEINIQPGDICLFTQNKIIFFRNGTQFETRELLGR